MGSTPAREADADQGAASLASSYRQILRSSSIVASASIINILIGLVRTKIVALVLGPTGLGLVGVFHSLMATGSSVAALGIGNVGTRQIAEAESIGDQQSRAVARRSFFWAALLLSLAGALVFWTFRSEIAWRVFEDRARAGQVGWLSIGVALGVASSAQIALLTGLRHIGNVARVSVFSALFGTAAGLACIFLWAEEGLLLYVIASPVTTFLVGWYFASKLPKAHGSTPLAQLSKQWRIMARLGFAFMLASLAQHLGHLLVRILVQRKLGLVDLGLFQAAWMISMTYIGLVLTAMSTDYYPRLAGAIHDHRAANRMVNDQAEVGLLLGGPLLLGMLGFAPWILQILYSSQFVPAVETLRWQVLGDVLKILLWPIGYVLLAAGEGRKFALSEAFSMICLVGATWLFLPVFGLQGAGLSVFVMYAIYLPVICFVAHGCTGYRVARRVAVLFFRLLLACAATVGASRISEALAMVSSLVLALLFTKLALDRLEDALPPPVRAVLDLGRRAIAKARR